MRILNPNAKLQSDFQLSPGGGNPHYGVVVGGFRLPTFRRPSDSPPDFRQVGLSR